MNKLMSIIIVAVGILLASIFVVCAQEGGDTRTEFSNMFGTTCTYDNGIASWYEGNSFKLAFYDCYRLGAQPSDTCCPDHYNCDIPSHTCVPSTSNYCSQYQTPNECNNNYNPLIAKNSVELNPANAGYCSGKTIGDPWTFTGAGGIPVTCENRTGDCKCLWVGDSSTGHCEGHYGTSIFCTNGTIYPIGTCNFLISESGNCSSGYMALAWTASWEPSTVERDPGCVNGEKTIPCPIQLSFMSIASIIIAIVLIVVAYIIISRKKEVHSKKRR